jgi:glycosyltransferase involved in cell wall biosynthesis
MASSPVKQGELMAMGVPVICNAGVGDSDRIVQQYHSGVLVGHYSDQQYAAAIDQLKSLSFDAAEIRTGSIDYFDLGKGIEAYADIYQRLLPSKSE